MTTIDRPIYHCADILLEAKTPICVSTGVRDRNFDTEIVRDASGLPAIPGTSIAGVLRHLVTGKFGADATREIFGFQETKRKGGGHDDAGKASRLQVGWARLVGKDGQPVTPHYLDGNDDLLDWYRNDLRETPVVRDRVALNDRGVAKDTGKYDVSILPVGTRFMLRLALWSKSAELGCDDVEADEVEDGDRDFKRLLGLFFDLGFRVGGDTRSGFGALRPAGDCAAGIEYARFDLTNENDLLNFAKIRQSAQPEYLGGGRIAANSDEASRVRSICLPLRFDGPWRIGQGKAGARHKGQGKAADLLPVTEIRVQWEGGSAQSKEVATEYALLPASGIKGALRHRTAFHFNALSGRFDRTPDMVASGTPDGTEPLFGDVKKEQGDGKADDGHVGMVVIDDIFPTAITNDNTVIWTHVSIDRFSGGARAGMLFSEEVLAPCDFDLEIAFVPQQASDLVKVDPLLLEAFAMALEDLAEGRLSLGARGTTGHGIVAWKSEADRIDLLESLKPIFDGAV